jgi:TolB-like protein
MQSDGAKTFRFQQFALDLRSGGLRAGDREIELRPKSFEVLHYLVENAGRLVPKDELITAVWRNVAVADEALARCISDIRLALNDKQQSLIKTLPRRGYLFAAPVKSEVSDRSPHGSVNNADGATSDGRVHDATAPPFSVVVLPFANLSGDPGQDFLADVITDGLTTSLSRIRDAFVIARSTASTYKGKAADVREVGRKLGVRYVLEGSEQHNGDRVRVSAQLIDVQSGAYLWADRFDADLADLLQMQDDIVTRLVRALQIELAAVEAGRLSKHGASNASAEGLAFTW